MKKFQTYTKVETIISLQKPNNILQQLSTFDYFTLLYFKANPSDDILKNVCS